MGSIGVSLVILIASSLLSVYLFYGFASINPNIEQQDVLVWVFGKRAYIRGLAIAGEYIGLGHRLNNSRYLSTTSVFSLGLTANYEGVQALDDTLDGVPVRLYEPKNRAKNTPALIWIHGGGWVGKAAASDDFLMAEMSRRLGILIMSIDYRLAPEQPYPTPFDDCFKASLAFLQSANKYGFNPKRVAISGASAGGNLAAAVSLKFRDTEQPIIFRHQILIVPCLQMFDLNTPSYQLNSQDAFLPKYWMTYYWLWYGFGPDAHLRYNEFMDNQHTSAAAKQSKLGSYVKHAFIPAKYHHASYAPNQENFGNETLWNEIKDLITDPYFAPLMATNLKNLPPAYIATAHYDVLRDDGIMYGKRLEAAGVMMHLAHYDTGFHAMIDFFETLDLSKRVLGDLTDYLKQNL